MLAHSYRYFLPNLAKLSRSQPSYSLIGEPIRFGELFQAKNQVPLVSNVKGSLIIDLANNTKDSDSTRLLRRFDVTKRVDSLYEPYSIFIDDEKYPEVFPLEERQEKLRKQLASTRYEHFFLFNFIYRNFLQPLLTYDNLETNDGSSDLAIDYSSIHSSVEGTVRCFGESSVRQLLATRYFGRMLRPVFLQRKLRSRPQKNVFFGRYDYVSARFFTNQRRLGNRFRLLGKNHRTPGTVYYWLGGFQQTHLAFNARFPRFAMPHRLFTSSMEISYPTHSFFSGSLLSLVQKQRSSKFLATGSTSLLLPTYRGSAWFSRAQSMEFAFSLQRTRTKLFATIFKIFLLALENIPQIYNKTRYGRLNKAFLHQVVGKLSSRAKVFLGLSPYFNAAASLAGVRLSHRVNLRFGGANDSTVIRPSNPGLLFRDKGFNSFTVSLLMAQMNRYVSSYFLLENLVLPRLPSLGLENRTSETIRLLQYKQNEEELIDLEQEELDHWEVMSNGQFLISEDFRAQRERTGQVLRDLSARQAPLEGQIGLQPSFALSNSFQVRLARLRALRHWPGGFASVLRHRRRFSRHAILLRAWSLIH